MKKKRFNIIRLFAGIVIIYGLLFIIDRQRGNWLVRNSTERILEVETGDLLVRSNSFFFAETRLYKKSGFPGHVAVVISNGTFSTGDPLMNNCKVAEARFFDHSKRRIVRSAGINLASENFAGFRERRFLLRSHLTENQKKQLLQFVNEQVGKPYKLFSEKGNNEVFNCATFAHEAILFSTGKDVDANGGKMVLPNDILKSPYYNNAGDRIRF